MIPVSINMDKVAPELRRFMDEVAEKNADAASKMINKIGYTIESNVKRAAQPHRITGGYIRSIKFLRAGGLSGSVYSNLKIARYLETGAKPHTIYPKGGGVLRFTRSGSIVFAQHVSHPGFRAFKVFEMGLNNSKGSIEAQIKAAYSFM